MHLGIRGSRALRFGALGVSGLGALGPGFRCLGSGALVQGFRELGVLEINPKPQTLKSNEP